MQPKTSSIQYLASGKIARINIYLDGIAAYQDNQNAFLVYEALRSLKAAENISDAKMIEECSMLCMMRHLHVYTPLIGDVEGYQKYLIPSGAFFGTRRRLSYALQRDENGAPIYFPPRYEAQTQAFDLYVQVKQCLRRDGFGTAISQYV